MLVCAGIVAVPRLFRPAPSPRCPAAPGLRPDPGPAHGVRALVVRLRLTLFRAGALCVAGGPPLAPALAPRPGRHILYTCPCQRPGTLPKDALRLVAGLAVRPSRGTLVRHGREQARGSVPGTSPPGSRSACRPVPPIVSRRRLAAWVPRAGVARLLGRRQAWEGAAPPLGGIPRDTTVAVAQDRRKAIGGLFLAHRGSFVAGK